MFTRSTHIFVLLLLSALSGPIRAQYTLNEVGAQVGTGLVTATTDWVGPSFHAEGFWAHYFCGKAYGIQANGGLNADKLYLSNADGGFIGGQRPVVNLLQATAGAYFRIRPADFHRSKEWAFLVGPRIELPLVSRVNSAVGSQPLSDVAPVFLRVHGAFQIRRPMGDHSIFFTPAVSWSIASDIAPQYQRFHFQFSIAYTFWDARG